MSIGLLCALINAALLAVLAAIFRHVAQKRIPIVPYNALTAALALALSLPFVEWKALSASPGADLPALAGAMLVAGLANAVVWGGSMVAMRLGHSAVTYAIGQSAMAVSFTYAVLVWGEPLSVLRVAGIAMVVMMLCLVAPRETGETEEAKGHHAKWLIAVSLTFVGSGVAQIFYMVPSHWPGWSDRLGLQMPLLLAALTAGCVATALVRREPLRRDMFLPAVAMAIMAVASLRILIVALGYLSPLKLIGLVYPISTAGAVLLFCAYSHFVLHEAYNARKWAGIAAGVAGIILLCCP